MAKVLAASATAERPVMDCFHIVSRGLRLLAAVLLLTTPAPAQDDPVATSADETVARAVPRDIYSESQLQGSIELVHDTDTQRSLLRIQKQIDRGDSSGAAHNLGILLEKNAQRDFFLRPDGHIKSGRSFAAHLHWMVGRLDASGREAYEQEFGTKAKQLLQSAETVGGMVELQAILRQYLHTEAGYASLFRLGLMYRDRGRHREAAEAFQRLRAQGERASDYEPRLTFLTAVSWLRDGHPDRAKSLLDELRKSAPNFEVTLRGESVKLFEQAEPLAWLDATLGTRTSAAAAATARSVGKPFLDPLWTQTLTEDGGLLSEIAQKTENARYAGRTVLPAYQPLVVGETLLLKTPDGFRALSLTTGKPLWEFSAESSHTSLMQDVFWHTAFHTLPHDGSKIFLVEDVPNRNGVGVANPASMDPFGGPGGVWPGGGFGGGGGIGGGFFAAQGLWGMNMMQAETNEDASVAVGPGANCLRARAIGDGHQANLVWQVGGGARPGSMLENITFLGNPLVDGRQLFILGESARTIRLIVLSTETGELLWGIDLAQAPVPIENDPYRRRVGATPVLAEGVVVCPTAGGGVVAVDLAMRSLLWAYRYPRLQQTRNNPNQGYVAQMSQPQSWLDGTIRIAGDKIVLTPMESELLHVLDLHSGRLLWKRNRDKARYVGCVTAESVMLVADEALSSLRLADGKPSWPSPVKFEAGASPSGRGVKTASGSYYQPLSDARVLEVDLSSGEVLDARSSSRQVALGNIDVQNGLYVAAGTKYVQVFETRKQLEQRAARALTKDPQDAHALLIQGRLAQFDGKTAEAISLFRRAYEREQSAKARNLLTTALLEGVRSSDERKDAWSAELDRLFEAARGK